MKKIEAIVRPMKLDELKTALGEIGVTGLSVSDVRGRGSTLPPGVTGRIVELPIRTRIEIVVRDEDVDEVVSTIERCARTGEYDDGKIFISPMRDAIRVRTEERGEAVL